MPNDYTELERLARHQLTLEKTIEELSERLNGFRKMHREVSESAVPEAVDGLEWDEDRMRLDQHGDEVIVKLDSIHIKVKDTFHPSITKAHAPEAHAWIRANGGEALLTNDLTLSFRRNEGPELVKTTEMLMKLYPEREPQIETAIHAATLKKFCREKLTEGVDVPEVLGVFNRREASVVNIPKHIGSPAVHADDPAYQ